VILLSGDRHFGEISKFSDGSTVVHEVTSSGMTHHWMSFPGEKNALRIGQPVVRKNFGTLEIDWDAGTLTAALRGVDGNALESIVLPLAP
jgi:alkaline phosphatase D